MKIAKITHVVSVVALANSLSFFVTANEIDPSDLTATNTFGSLITDNNGKVQGMFGLAGSYSEGNNFIGLVEHGVKTRGDEQGIQDTRLRYFQVLDTGYQGVSQVGFSVDYMKGWSKDNDAKGKTPESDLVALGVIGKVATPWESFSLFPNVAYVTGNASQEIDSKSAIKADLKGYQVNLFGSIDLGSAGYIILQPQFMSLDVDFTNKELVNTPERADVFQMKTGYGIPFTSSGKWWAELSHTYTRTNTSELMLGGTEKLVDNDNKFELSISYYF